MRAEVKSQCQIIQPAACSWFGPQMRQVRLLESGSTFFKFSIWVPNFFCHIKNIDITHHRTRIAAYAAAGHVVALTSLGRRQFEGTSIAEQP
jgi:hypothetical protein